MKYIVALISQPTLLFIFSSKAFASEPGGTALVVFFVGMVLAPILQLILYPILVLSDRIKPWTIIVFGIISILWSTYVSYSLADVYAALYLMFSVIIFVFSYFNKSSRVKKNT